MESPQKKAAGVCGNPVCQNGEWTELDFDVQAILDLSYTTLEGCLQCFDAVGWAAGRASGL